MTFTPVWCTGFEMGTLPIRAGTCWTDGSISVNTEHKTGSYGLSIGSSYASGSLYVATGGIANFVLGCWAYWYRELYADLLLANGNTMVFKAGPTPLGYDSWNYTYGGTTVYGVVPIPPTGNVAWHNLQIMITAGLVEVRVDGALSISYSSGVTSNVNRVEFHGTGGAGTYAGNFDDISIGSGTWAGDIRYDRLKPNGDTSVHDWRPNTISLQVPPSAPTVAVSGSSGLTGDYYYKVTLVDTLGETFGGTTSALVQPSSQQVDLSNIAIGLDGTTARKIYRTEAGGSTFKLAATISDNTTTIYSDTLPDISLGAAEPTNVHYTTIDDIPASDADYIHTATNGDQDLHEMEDWDATEKEPIFVVHWERMWKNSANLQQIKLLLKSGISSTLDSSAAKDLLTSVAYVHEIDVTDPDGNPWTNAEIDAIQAGVEAVIP